MIKNNFRIFLAQRKEKVKKVSEETGISRTTLTAIYYERAKGITFEVLEKLCDYFGCSVGDMFYIEGD